MKPPGKAGAVSQNGTGAGAKPRPVYIARLLHPDRLRVQAVLPDILHDLGHAG